MYFFCVVCFFSLLSTTVENTPPDPVLCCVVLWINRMGLRFKRKGATLRSADKIYTSDRRKRIRVLLMSSMCFNHWIGVVSLLEDAQDLPNSNENTGAI